MKTKFHCFFIALALIAGVHQAAAQGTAFTYQGQLQNSGSPVNGGYDLTFTLFNVNAGGVAIVGPVTNSATAVSNGLFTTTIDFGAGIFTGTSNWLQIAVRTNDTGSFITLTPRQQITPTPYAIYAPNAGAALTAGTAGSASSVSAANITGTVALTQLPGAVVTSNNTTSVTLSGAFSGNGAGLTNLNPSGIAGGQVGPALFFTNQDNLFNGYFYGYFDGNGNYLTNLNPSGIAGGQVGPALFFTNQDNLFNGYFYGSFDGNGNYLTNLNPSGIAGGQVGQALFFTNQDNLFNGYFYGSFDGNGNYLTNLNASQLTGGSVPSAVLTSVPAASLTGTVALTQLPSAVVTNNNTTSVTLSGAFSGNGAGLTNLSTGGITTNVIVGGHTFYITNGIIVSVQ
jgi:hypothetical protein